MMYVTIVNVFIFAGYWFYSGEVDRHSEHHAEPTACIFNATLQGAIQSRTT